jgi:hypothetical protein
LVIVQVRYCRCQNVHINLHALQHELVVRTQQLASAIHLVRVQVRLLPEGL